jgi:MGT family glycosyltransferase
MTNSNLKTQADEIGKIAKGKRILFATVPADGHVNPLTGVAVYLKSLGYDVRWYTSNKYAEKINKLHIQHYPFIKALDIRGDNVNELLPDRLKHKGMVAKLNFDIINFFIKRSTEYFADIKEIYNGFLFDLMIADCAFTAIPFVKEKMNIPVIAMGVLPLSETSKNLPPSGLGMVPSYTLLGKLKQSALRWIAANVLFKKSSNFLAQVTKENGISYEGQTIFDYVVKKASLFLQSATPGFEYYRSDLGSNIRFVGPLLPHSSGQSKTQWFDDRLTTYEKVIIVTQGTVEKDVEKLLVPTLEAFKNSDVLVVVTTGGSGTMELRKRYPEANIIIEDFIPFDDVMPYADVYVTNGGYGGVMLGIENELPLVVGGVHEGKNEICARVGYFKLGINLKTETPTPSQIKNAVEVVFTTPDYKENVCRMSKEFATYNANALTASYVRELLTVNGVELEKDAREVVY